MTTLFNKNLKSTLFSFTSLFILSLFFIGCTATEETTTPEEESTEITHNSITYDVVTSPYTGRVWLDRNLGASQVCTALDDSDCYGDYYQWGRDTDGHEKSDSNTTTTKSTSIENVGHNNFIATSGDWASVDGNGSLRSAKWSSTDGTSVCPSGFRVPTMNEIKVDTMDEGVTNSATAFSSFLKIPSAGQRTLISGTMSTLGEFGNLMSSTIDTTYGKFQRLHFQYTALQSNVAYGSGGSVRCIQDESSTPNQAPTADAGNDVSIILGESVTLSGSGSSDSDGTIASYLWKKDAVNVGVDANLTLASLTVGTHTYTLVVTDDDGDSSSADSVVVTVSEEVINVGLYATGQTISQQAYDDGAYLKGTVKTYTRGSDIVEDPTLNIQWQDNNSTPEVNYSDSILICNNLTLGGYMDWRLPTIYELITVVDISRSANTVPAINSTFINMATPSGLSWAYWSSTEHKAVTGTAFNLNFWHGSVDAGGVGANMFVKCVRDTP